MRKLKLAIAVGSAGLIEASYAINDTKIDDQDARSPRAASLKLECDSAATCSSGYAASYSGISASDGYAASYHGSSNSDGYAASYSGTSASDGYAASYHGSSASDGYAASYPGTSASS